MGLYILIGLCIGASIVMLIQCKNAPHGYEDETGFHFDSDRKVDSNKK